MTFARSGTCTASIRRPASAPDREVPGRTGLFTGRPARRPRRAIRLGRTCCRSPGWTAPARRSRKSWSARARGGTGETRTSASSSRSTEYEQLRGGQPRFEPARPVMAANVRPHGPGAGAGRVITDPLAARGPPTCSTSTTRSCSSSSRVLRAHHRDRRPAQGLADASVALMVQVIKPLGSPDHHPAARRRRTRGAQPAQLRAVLRIRYLMPHSTRPGRCCPERRTQRAWLCSELCAGRARPSAAQLGTGASTHPPKSPHSPGPHT